MSKENEETQHKFYNLCKQCSNKTMSLKEDICWTCQQKRKPLNTDEILLELNQGENALFLVLVFILVFSIILFVMILIGSLC